MESRDFISVVIVFLLFPSSPIMTMESPSSLSKFAENETGLSSGDPTIDSGEKRLLLECQHSDYRTYIKCLKRHKRHHLRHGGESGDEGETTRCFNDCGMEQCESAKCVHDCHRRCMKTTKETHQIITQYETSCVSGDCADKSEARETPMTNVTTNIDINNVINNHMPSTDKREREDCRKSGDCGERRDGSNGGGPGGRTDTGSPRVPNPYDNPPGPNWPCAPGNWQACNTGGFSLVPQIQLVPQITLGLGFGGVAAPPYWPNVYHQAGGIDCSPCGNPFLRYRCDVTCYQGSPPAIPSAGRGAGRSSADCIAPHCVGGS